jgi:hypothetical protein
MKRVHSRSARREVVNLDRPSLLAGADDVVADGRHAVPRRRKFDDEQAVAKPL